MSRFDTLREGVPDALPSAFGDDSDSDETTDPHKWTDDRSKTWRDRVTPDSPRRRFYLYAFILVLAGALLFFMRFIPTAPSTLMFVGGIAAAPVAYYHGYKRGFETFKRMDVSIIYNPDSESGLRVRFGEFVDSADSGHLLFRPYSAEAFSGLQQRYMQLKHIFGNDVAPAKFGRGISDRTSGDGVGENPVRDKLPAPFTAEVSTSAFGRVAVTLSSGLEKRPRRKEYDREAELPTLASDATMAEVRSYLTELTEIQIPALMRQLQTQRERAEGRADDRERRTKEYLDDLTTLMQEIPGAGRGRGRSRSGSSSGNGDSAESAGGEVDIDAVRDLDEEVADRLEEQHGGEL